MDAAMWGFVGALAGTVVGAVASIATTVIANRHEARLQAQADSLSRSERSRAFQRENLLAVQDALQDLGRLTSRAHLDNLVAHRKGAPWGQTPLSEEVGAGLGLAHRRLSALVERIADDSLRSELKETHSKLTWETMGASKEESESRGRDSDEAYGRAMPHLGTVLRDHY